MADIKEVYARSEEYQEYARQNKGNEPTVEKFLQSMAPADRVAFEEKYREKNEQNPAKNNELENKQPENAEKINEEARRERSASSDQNEFLMDKVKLKTFLDMKIINEELYNSGMANPAAAIESLNKIRPLNEEETTRFDEVMLDNVLEQGLLDLTPPSVLAEQYEKQQQKKAEKQAAAENADVTEENRKIAVLENRMMTLSENLYNKEELFFADVTNTGDTYDGYLKITDVLDKYVATPEQDTAKKQNLEKMLNANRETLNAQIDEYDAGWNMENASPKRAEEIDRRYDEVSSMLDSVVIDDETLALTGNFKFVTNGEVEQPFVDKEGRKSSSWTQGATIDPESKLATVVRIAKQNALQSVIADNDKISQESLNREVSDQLGAALYSFSVGDKVVQGILEKPDAFTDKTQREEFLNDLRNAEKPVYLSETGFEAGVDASIDQSAAYASRLNKKLGKDNQVAVKILEPLKDLDKRAADRTEDSKLTKREARITLAKRGLKNGVSAFLVSGAITVAATATATDASLTAATMGMNKFAGAAIGTTLAITAASRSIIKWRKQRKAEGKPRGLMSMLKDPRLATTLATTALGGAALGFAATGNPGVAMACGGAALAIGAGSSVVYTAKDARKMGLGKGEALGWGVVNAAITIGAGFGGRAAANFGIDLYNQHNPDNTVFQHQEKIGEHVESVTETRTHMVIDYGALNENAQDFLQDNWYKDNPELLQSRIDALSAAGVENPYHTLLVAHDAGLVAPDNMQMWDGSTSNGNHTVLTHGWAEQNGVNPDSVDAIKNLFNNDGSVNADAVAAYKELAPHVGEDNFVSRIEDRPVIRELYGDRESTYDHDRKLPLKEETYTVGKSVVVDDYGMVKNDNEGAGVGMLGMLAGPFKGVKKLKQRVGSLLDKITKKEKTSQKSAENAEKIPVTSTPAKDKPGFTATPAKDKPGFTATPAKDKLGFTATPVKDKPGLTTTPVKDKPGLTRSAPDPRDPTTFNLDKLYGDNVGSGMDINVPYHEVPGYDSESQSGKVSVESRNTPETEKNPQQHYVLTDKDKETREYSEALSRAMSGDANAIEAYRRQREKEEAVKSEVREHVQKRKEELKARAHEWKGKMHGSVVADRFAEEDIHGAEISENTPEGYKQAQKQREADKKEFKETGKIDRFMRDFQRGNGKE